MTYLACPIIIPLLEAVEECLSHAREAKEDGARLIEWRIDALEPSEEVAQVITRLVDECPTPCIVTCRPQWEGGQFDSRPRMPLVGLL